MVHPSDITQILRLQLKPHLSQLTFTTLQYGKTYTQLSKWK